MFRKRIYCFAAMHHALHSLHQLEPVKRHHVLPAKMATAQQVFGHEAVQVGTQQIFTKSWFLDHSTVVAIC